MMRLAACSPAHALLRSLTTTVLTQSVSPHDCSPEQLVLWEGSGSQAVPLSSSAVEWNIFNYYDQDQLPTTITTVSQPDNVKHTQTCWPVPVQLDWIITQHLTAPLHILIITS